MHTLAARKLPHSSPSIVASSIRLLNHRRLISTINFSSFNNDVSDSDSEDTHPKERLRIAREIGDAARREGFLYLKNTPFLTSDLMDRATIQTKWFFSLPQQEKERLQTHTGQRGYYKYISSGGLTDNIEAFNIGKEAADPFELRRAYFEASYDGDLSYLPEQQRHALSRQNAWPSIDGQDSDQSNHNIDEYGQFQSTMLEYYDACSKTAALVLEAIALDASLPVTFFANTHAQTDHNLEIKHYPIIKLAERSQESGDFGSGSVRLREHSDLSMVTLLAQDTVSGLEVLDESTGEWSLVPAQKDCILVNTGEFMQEWSGGRLKSTQHRVVSADGSFNEPRFSLVYFATPDWDVVIDEYNIDLCAPAREQQQQQQKQQQRNDDDKSVGGEDNVNAVNNSGKKAEAEGDDLEAAIRAFEALGEEPERAGDRLPFVF